MTALLGPSRQTVISASSMKKMGGRLSPIDYAYSNPQLKVCPQVLQKPCDWRDSTASWSYCHRYRRKLSVKKTHVYFQGTLILERHERGRGYHWTISVKGVIPTTSIKVIYHPADPPLNLSLIAVLSRVLFMVKNQTCLSTAMELHFLQQQRRCK